MKIRRGSVYLARCTATAKGYVGQTWSGLRTRLAQHLSRPERRAATSALAAAVGKYGRAAFTIELLEECADQAALDAAEISWIARLGTASPGGYNVRAGGARGPHTEETRRKLAARPVTPEWRAAISRAMRGRPASPEARARLAAGRARGPTRPQVGEANPNARLTWPRVDAIRLPAGEFTQGELARVTGLTQAHIGRIVRGIAWNLNRKPIPSI
jgi:group I intron endonuclease